MAGEQRHIDRRVSMLKDADTALRDGHYYLAKSCLRLVLDDVLHSNDLYIAEHDPVTANSEDARHKIALWLLTEAPYRVDAIARPEAITTDSIGMPDSIDDPERTIVMAAVA